MRNATFDALDKVSTVQKQSGQDYTFQYDPDSRTTTLTLGSGVVRTYGLDPLSRLTTQIDYAGSNPISTFIDTYDPVGNRIGRVQDGATNFVWTYDNDYRLLGQQAPGATATFSYDPVYNTLLKWHQGQAPLTMSFDPATRLTTSIQGSLVTSFTFDNAGNQIVQNANGVFTTFIFDPENRLSQQQSAVGNSTYTYQGYNGLRRSANEPAASVTTFVWDGTDYLQERD